MPSEPKRATKPHQIRSGWIRHKISVGSHDCRLVAELLARSFILLRSKDHTARLQVAQLVTRLEHASLASTKPTQLPFFSFNYLLVHLAQARTHLKLGHCCQTMKTKMSVTCISSPLMVLKFKCLFLLHIVRVGTHLSFLLHSRAEPKLLVLATFLL